MAKNPEAIALAHELFELRDAPIDSFVEGQLSSFTFVDLPRQNLGGGNVVTRELNSDGAVLSERKIGIEQWVGEFRELTRPRVPRNLLPTVAGELAYKAWYQNCWDTDPEFMAAF